MDKIFNYFIRQGLISQVINRHFSHSCALRTVDEKIVESLERLALVDFSTEAGVERLKKSIEFADKLMEVNTENVELLISTVHNRNDNIRSDAATENSHRDELMKIAPITEEFYYVAPIGTFSRKQSEQT